MEVIAAASPALAAADATSKARIHSPRRPGAAIPSSRLTFDGRKILRKSIIELESLGEGTFGRVCRCSIPGAAGGDTIAMKLVETQLADVIEDAKRELDIMSQLRGVSPFVVHGRGGGCTSDQQVVILLDFMEGGNLLSRIQQQPLDEDSTRFYAASIIMGLDALHSRHILVSSPPP
jgi:serine/threonine protein kinase